MNRFVKGLPIWLVSIVFISYGAVHAQVSSDPFFAFNEMSFLTEESGLGARALSMGGAFVGLADDYSAIYWNPAGLGYLKNHEIFVSLSNNNLNMDVNFLGGINNNDQSKTAFDALGYAYVADTYQGSLVFALGYNRVENYNSFFGYSGINPGFSEYVIDDVAYLLDDLNQSESIEIDGNLSQFSAGFSIEFSPEFYLGATLSYWDGENNFTRISRETDSDDLYGVFPTDIFQAREDEFVNSDIAGLGLLLGASFQQENFRIGGTINLPRYFSIKEEWSESFATEFDDGFIEEELDNGLSEYDVLLPFAFGLGGSYSYENITLAGDIGYTDWSQFKYRDQFPVGNTTKGEANRNIKQTLEGVLTPKIGLEVKISQANLALRTGFSHIPSPLKDADSKLDRKYFSLGLGVVFNELSELNIAYRRGWWESASFSNFSGELTSQDIVDNKVLATLSIRIK